jgi:uroporphyrinogen-III synthase
MRQGFCLVITRPLPDGERTAAALRAHGHEVLVAPLMRVENIAADLSGHWTGVVITSANAVRALIDNPQRAKLLLLPVFVVGRRTAEATREAGFSDVTSADGDGGNLAELIVARFKGAASSLLYLAAADRAVNFEGELKGMGVALKTAVIYRAVTAPYPPVLIEALRAGTVDAVLHFSRRSADNYLAGARAAGIAARAFSPQHLCLSAQVAEPLAAAGAPVRVAVRPDEAALLDLLESL